jgi:putative ABC transport system permease protein
MIRNNLKISLRSIRKNKLTAFINISGLAIAMGAVLLIYVYIVDELSYDQYNSKIDRTYRVTREFIDDTGVVNGSFSAIAPAFGPVLKNDFGEIEAAARTLSFFDFDMAVEENGERTRVAHEEEVFLVEPDVFTIFDISVVSGNPLKDLERPFTVMLSEKMAQKYFSSKDVVGKRLQGIAAMKVAATDNYDLEVIGVYKDFPSQSHWHPDFLMAFSTLNDSTIYGRNQLEDFGDNAFDTYVLLEAGTSPQRLEAALPAFLDKNLGAHARANWGVSQNWVASKANKLHLQPVADIHLRSQFADEIEVNGNINNVYMMGMIGLFILLIACFNFINLSTARATNRAKEVGMRKVVGALKSQLIVQYLSESVLIAFFALLLALAFATTALPWINNFTGKSISLDLISQWPLFAGMTAFAFMVGILAGTYPAFIISAFRPAAVLKGQPGSVTGKGGIRRVLVVAQFSVSIVLIIATAVTIQQLGYLNTRDLGYDKDQIITLRGYAELDNNYDAFYNSLASSSAIRNIARSSRLPTGRLLDWWGGVSVVKGDSLVDTGIVPKSLAVDYEFFSTYGIQLAAGRSFSRAFSSDASEETRAFVINETAARRIGWKSPEEGIGKDFKYGDATGKLIGIVKDFNFESLHHEILPMVFFLGGHNSRNLSVQIDGARFQQGIAELEKRWKEFLPARPFEYQFMSERYRRLYEADQKQSQLFAIFSAVAIFIACLGLFGLAAFNTLQRIKEIAIRKVLGATVTNILALLSREIVTLIVVASIIAWPIAWLVMRRWLSTFAYHIDMSVLVYALTAIGTIIVALLTVSVQALRAALVNPSSTLHNE